MVFLLSFSNAIIDLTINKGFSNNDNSILAVKCFFCIPNWLNCSKNDMPLRFGFALQIHRFFSVGMGECAPFFCHNKTIIPIQYVSFFSKSPILYTSSRIVASTIPSKSGSQPSSQHTHVPNINNKMLLKFYRSTDFRLAATTE